MHPSVARVRLALFTLTFSAGGTAGSALAAPAPTFSPSPRPSAAPAGRVTRAAQGDPCGGPDRLLATLNRPTIGFSACAVPPGAIVLEEGYQNQAQSGASPAVAVSYPQGFERFGVVPGLELDAIGPNFNRVRSARALETGTSDLGVGFKYEFAQRGRFTYAVDGLFTAASGSNGFTAGGPTQTIDVDVAYAASPSIGIGTTVAGASLAGFSAAGEAGRFGALIPSAVLTAEIPNGYQFYAEVVAQSKLVPDRGGHVFGDFGVQKLLGPYLEVDIEDAQSFTPLNGSRFHYLGIGTGIRLR
jgi:hypothetical protein